MLPKLYIGPAGWSYPDWNGIVYPRRRPARFDHLEYLASYFNLIEINSTFYRVPTPSTCSSWARRVSHHPDFKFSVKAFQGFTHAQSRASERDVAGFKAAVGPLLEADRLSTVLIQFPWSFRFSQPNMRYIAKLVGWFAPCETSVEVRHGSWGRPEAIRFFVEEGIVMCGVDQPLIGDSLRPDRFVPGHDSAYLRFHGRNRVEWFRRDTNRDLRYNYLYSIDELSDWVERIQEIGQEVGRLHVVLNNHFRGQAVANALSIRALLEDKPVNAPRGVVDAYPSLSAWLRADTAWDEAVSRDEPPSLFEDGNG